MARRTAPRDLGPSGRALWRQVAAWMREHRLVADPHELPLLEELARTVDRLASLRETIAGMHPADPAWTRLAGEERQQRLAYGRLISAIGLPTGVVPEVQPGEKVVGLSAASRRGLKAARSRWGAAGGRRADAS